MPTKEAWRRRKLRAFSQRLGWISSLQAAEQPQGPQEGRLVVWGVLKLRRSPGRSRVSARCPGGLRRPNACLAKSAVLS